MSELGISSNGNSTNLKAPLYGMLNCLCIEDELLASRFKDHLRPPSETDPVDPTDNRIEDTVPNSDSETAADEAESAVDEQSTESDEVRSEKQEGEQTDQGAGSTGKVLIDEVKPQVVKNDKPEQIGETESTDKTSAEGQHLSKTVGPKETPESKDKPVGDHVPVGEETDANRKLNGEQHKTTKPDQPQETQQASLTATDDVRTPTATHGDVNPLTTTGKPTTNDGGPQTATRGDSAEQQAESVALANATDTSEDKSKPNVSAEKPKHLGPKPKPTAKPTSAETENPPASLQVPDAETEQGALDDKGSERGSRHRKPGDKPFTIPRPHQLPAQVAASLSEAEPTVAETIASETAAAGDSPERESSVSGGKGSEKAGGQAPSTASAPAPAVGPVDGNVARTTGTTLRANQEPEQIGTLTSAQTSRFVGRVARAFEFAQDRGGSLQLRLSPPELGSLRLEVSVKDGVVAARMEAETHAAKSLLLENLGQLRERLAEQNIRIDTFDVDVNDQSSSQPEPRGYQGRNDGNTGPGRADGKASPVGSTVTESADDQSPPAPAWANGRLDMVA